MKQFFEKVKHIFVQGFYAVLTFIIQHKITSAVVLGVVAAVVAVSIVLTSVLSVPTATDLVSSSDDTVSEVESVPEISSEPEILSEPQEVVSSEAPPESTVSSEPPVASTPVVITPPADFEYKYNPNMTPDNNVFLDALEYTGYNLTAQRNSGLMWASGSNYVLSSRKRGLGWLSNITYDDYGRASGYEVNEQGLPNIPHFEKNGLVCATYAAYVYFNYLPNVAGIDTSALARPAKSYSANDWYIAGKQWVDAGYSRYIDFTASDGGSIYNDIRFSPAEQIPIGSLIILCDWYNRSQWCSHICIYAGYMNGYHWVTHVGNENGPEFCAIERMNRKPHPQWPIAVITTPSNLNFDAPAETPAE